MADQILETMMEKLSLFMTNPIYAASDRNRLIQEQLKALKWLDAKDGCILKTTSICTAPNRSMPAIPIDKANMISIDDILRDGPEVVHEGKILVCRSIMPGARVIALAIVVDDPSGDRCLRVCIYNFSADIRPGTILAIMHPWFKISNDMSTAIRVENPQHVRIFTGNELAIRDLEWKAPLPKESGVTEGKPGPVVDFALEGNDYFKDKNYLQAVEAYSKAIEAHPRIPILYSNRALTYLKMEKPDRALEDTEIGLKLEPSNVKLLYRKGKALIGLKRHEEALSFLEKASEEHKEALKEKAFADMLKASKRMIAEARGIYDIMKMLEEAKRSKLLENHAGYEAVGKFEVKEVPGKGRGLVAKEKIEVGTLLMACKAFVFAEASEGAVSFDWSNRTMETVTFAPLVRKATEKLVNNPNLGDDFYKLYAGVELGWLEKADHSNPVDVDRIKGIIRLNKFAAENALVVGEGVPREKDAGLWITPSYLNHSCVDCNCFRYVIGDFMFLRATKDISPGDELLLEYVSPWEPFEKRRKVLRAFGIDCSCRLCQIDRNQPEDICKRWNEIDNTFHNIHQYVCQTGSFDPEDVVALKAMLQEVKKYRPDRELNFMADQIQKALSASSKSPIYRYQILEELFLIRERANDLHTALVYAKVLTAASAVKGEREVDKWVKTLKKLAKVLYGDERVTDLIAIQ